MNDKTRTAEPLLVSGMRRHPTGDVRHVPAAPTGACGTSTAGFLRELDEWAVAIRAEALRAAGRRALHHDDEMPEGKAAGLWMAIVHGGDTERDEDWQEAFAVARETRRAAFTARRQCPFCCRANDGDRGIEVRGGRFVRHLTGAGMECSGSGVLVRSVAPIGEADRG